VDNAIVARPQRTSSRNMKCRNMRSSGLERHDEDVNDAEQILLGIRGARREVSAKAVGQTMFSGLAGLLRPDRLLPRAEDKDR
jgi:hypothetical protein